jgi:hypothetical protein
VKRVLSVLVRIPELSRWQDIQFIDMPGLESSFLHNTEASLNWLPNAEIALVAIGVDPPLSQRDVELINRLLRYTPRVAVLLTKVDLLSCAEQREVLGFVRTELARKFPKQIPVYPYSTRSGYEELRVEMERGLIAKLAVNAADQRQAIMGQKELTLLRECEEYLRLTLRSSELLDSERADLKQQLLAERDALPDTKLEIQLIARHISGVTRQSIEKALAPYEVELREEILCAFDEESSSFPTKFASLLESFDDWLGVNLSSRLASLSEAKRNELLQPITDVQCQYRRLLQNFRDRLSERTLALYGLPLRTTEPDMAPTVPKTPDVNIGRVFDHSWELLSPIVPMRLLRSAVLHRFRHKIEYETFKNLSRLTSQWDAIVKTALADLRREAESRLEELIATVENLTSSSKQEAPQIRADLDELEMIIRTIQEYH